MATNLPDTIPALLNWAETHADLWTTHAASIGLSTAQASAFNLLAKSAADASQAADAARAASKNATLTLNDQVSALRGLAGAYVNLIKAFAETTNNPNVYALAGVSPDSPPGTLPPPNAPQQFTAGVNADGSLTIKWKVSQPTGVTNVQYVLSRRLGASGPFAIIGTVGASKSFTDRTLPLGVDQVQYLVQPRRGETAGALSPVFNVQFGSVGGPGLAAEPRTIASTSTSAGPNRLAA
ncbi:MAG: hypothetical protein KIT68_11240 [Phycisphaeraceae bacterium]|nr:hypothetical protein [Phycisphaeraceae bacterium]